MCEEDKMLKFVTLRGICSRGRLMLIVQQEYLSGTQVCIIEGNRRNDDSKVKIIINDSNKLLR